MPAPRLLVDQPQAARAALLDRARRRRRSGRRCGACPGPSWRGTCPTGVSSPERREQLDVGVADAQQHRLDALLRRPSRGAGPASRAARSRARPRRRGPRRPRRRGRSSRTSRRSLDDRRLGRLRLPAAAGALPFAGGATLSGSRCSAAGRCAVAPAVPRSRRARSGSGPRPPRRLVADRGQAHDHRVDGLRPRARRRCATRSPRPRSPSISSRSIDSFASSACGDAVEQVAVVGDQHAGRRTAPRRSAACCSSSRRWRLACEVHPRRPEPFRCASSLLPMPYSSIIARLTSATRRRSSDAPVVVRAEHDLLRRRSRPAASSCSRAAPPWTSGSGPPRAG